MTKQLLVSFPKMFFGTAWKERETKRLTLQAIEAGFRAIDTANQRRHYVEAAVGEAIQSALQRNLVNRTDLFLQTKFTFQRGQDHRLPYDPAAAITTQVEQSFANSLSNLGVNRIDSFLLHGPSTSHGLTDDDWQAWTAIERLAECDQVANIGVSNFSVDQLAELCNHATRKPSFVQNRCFAVQGWDRDVRQECKNHNIRYQGFSLLTANYKLLSRPEIAMMAKSYHATVPQLIFRFAFDLGLIPLTGTNSVEHMRQDLDIDSWELTAEDRNWLESNGKPQLR